MAGIVDVSSQKGQNVGQSSIISTRQSSLQSVASNQLLHQSYGYSGSLLPKTWIENGIQCFAVLKFFQEPIVPRNSVVN